MAKLTLEVGGMHCGSCGMLIDETLEEMPGVAASDTDVGGERTVVEYDPALTPPAALVEAIAGLGFQAKLGGP